MRLHEIKVTDLDEVVVFLARSSDTNQALGAILKKGGWRYRVTHGNHELDTPSLTRAVDFYNYGPRDEDEEE